jgi:hypothetical protein
MLYGRVYLSRPLSRARGTITAPVAAHYRFCLALDTEGPTTILVDSLLNFPTKSILCPMQNYVVAGQSKSSGQQGAAIPHRATARVPTPLHAAPALTMRTNGA